MSEDETGGEIARREESDKAYEASPLRSLPGQSGIVGSYGRPLSQKDFRLSLCLIGLVSLSIGSDRVIDR